jgi:hypothetical protein
MEKTNYKLALQAAMQEQSDLFEERRRIDARLAALKGTIEGLSVLVDDPPAKPSATLNMSDLLVGETGITAAIRLLLQQADGSLTPVQIRTELMSHGFDMSDYANAMAVIHNTLTRLERQGEVTRLDLPSGSVYSMTADLLRNVHGLSQPGKGALKADRIARAKEAFQKK